MNAHAAPPRTSRIRTLPGRACLRRAGRAVLVAAALGGVLPFAAAAQPPGRMGSVPRPPRRPPPARPAPAAAWEPASPQGGTVTALAFAAGLRGVAWVGSFGHGVWKTADGGATWKPTGGLPSGPISSVAASAADAGTAIAGTDLGVFKTSDGGATWTEHGPQREVVRVALAPTQPNLGYAVYTNFANGSLVDHSSDGGEIWLPSAGVPDRYTVLDLAVDPTDAKVAYMVGTGYQPGTGFPLNPVLRTEDGGATWHPAANLPISDTHFTLAIDPLAPWTLYLGWSDGIWKSLDGGVDWQAVVDDPRGNSPVSALAVDPLVPGTLYASIHGFHDTIQRSTDGGATWTTLTALPARVNALARDPFSPGALLAAPDRIGVLRSADGGAHWLPPVAGFAALDVSAIAASPTLPGLVFAVPVAAGEPLGLSKSANGGATWTNSTIFAGSVPGNPLGPRSILRFDPGNPDVLLVGAGDGLFASADGGLTWLYSFGPGHPLTAVSDLAFCQADPRVALVAGLSPGYTWYSRALASTDEGATWSELASLPGENAAHSYWSAAAITGRHCDFMLMAGYGSRLLRSADGGASWSAVGGGLPAGGDPQLDNGTVLRLIVDPLQPDTVYATLRNVPGVFMSTDDGSTWWQAAPDLAAGGVIVADLMPDPARGRIYAATNHGVYATSNPPARWAPLGTGLPSPNVLSLAIGARGPAALYAGTSLGVYKLPLAP
jgi:photosystem II stability/assembly factor-like uncharacterized protein